jgi:hypothetical protein
MLVSLVTQAFRVARVALAVQGFPATRVIRVRGKVVFQGLVLLLAFLVSVGLRDSQASLARKAQVVVTPATQDSVARRGIQDFLARVATVDFLVVLEVREQVGSQASREQERVDLVDSRGVQVEMVRAVSQVLAE